MTDWSKCSLCGTEEGPIIAAPAGWDSTMNRPANAPSCRRCAAQDGWPWLTDGPGNAQFVRDPRTGIETPYEEWSPSEEELDELIEHVS